MKVLGSFAGEVSPDGESIILELTDTDGERVDYRVPIFLGPALVHGVSSLNGGAIQKQMDLGKVPAVAPPSTDDVFFPTEFNLMVNSPLQQIVVQALGAGAPDGKTGEPVADVATLGFTEDLARSFASGLIDAAEQLRQSKSKN